MNKDLTQGSVIQKIVQLALPIIGTSFMQLAYSFTDMLWVGRLGSNAVAAIGTSGFFLHLGWALVSIVLVGCGISVSQAIGKKKEKKARYLSVNALVGVLSITAFYILIIQVGYKYFIGFFDLNRQEAVQMAYSYLRWSSVGLFFLFISRLFSGVSNARGDSKLPFKIASIGIVVNIVLDPVLIFVLDFGVTGAAWATIIAQMLVAIIYWNKRSQAFFGEYSSWIFALLPIRKMIRLGFPPSTQYIIFSLVAIVMGKIVSGFGSDAIAAQKIGLQIESITFMTIGGINGAILSFTGQNFGARQYKRVRQGFNAGIKVAIGFGGLMTAVFLVFPDVMVQWFVRDSATVAIGAGYLRIVGLSQIFMCVDMISTGVINGMGKTRLPASSNIIMILIRIPLALWLSRSDMFGVNGIWVAILISSMLRGLINASIYLYLKPRLLPVDANHQSNTLNAKL
ncbi:MATE family efflux transporter [Labilibacter sediminis]|nr:MATE family efflux transporter [Labilibacter sediminis]